MARPFFKNYVVADADADGYANDATGAAASITLAASSAGDGLAHQLNFTSTANLSGLTFTVTGTDENGTAQTEDVTGPNNNTVESTKYFLTVSSITKSATLGANTMDIGWVDEFVTPTVPLNRYAQAAAFEVVVVGTINYDVQQTLSKLTDSPPWNWTSIPAELVDAVDLIGITVSEQFRMSPVSSGVRLLASSYSSGAELSLYINYSL